VERTAHHDGNRDARGDDGQHKRAPGGERSQREWIRTAATRHGELPRHSPWSPAGGGVPAVVGCAAVACGADSSPVRSEFPSDAGDSPATALAQTRAQPARSTELRTAQHRDLWVLRDALETTWRRPGDALETLWRRPLSRSHPTGAPCDVRRLAWSGQDRSRVRPPWQVCDPNQRARASRD
jgi:hypothetical protein